MDTEDLARHCEKAWSQYAKKHNIRRYKEFFLLKLVEESGELARTFLELEGSEHRKKTPEELKKKFAGDCASVIGNALIMALYFGVDIEKTILEKFPAQ
jgi:NTP pyrophosphatase (non-canonical NTP hydrolase)